MSEDTTELVIAMPFGLEEEKDVDLDITQAGISQRQLIIIEQLAEMQNMFSILMDFSQHLDGTLAALVKSNNEIGTSQNNMQQTVLGMFASAKNSPMAKMMGLGKGGAQDG